MPLPSKRSLRTRLIVLLAFVLGNLALVIAFPPCDYLSLAHRGLPTFDGFYPIFDMPANRQINQNFLMLEVLVILINACLGYLLISQSKGPGSYHRLSRGLILFLGLNLVLIMLFPPFANTHSLSYNFIPSFEGFYFVFGDNTSRHLVDEVLFLEIVMLLTNAALVWLIMRESDLQDRMLEQRTDKPF